jgi:signal transduction histidine kinase
MVGFNMSASHPESPPPGPRVPRAKLVRGLAPAIVCWVALVGWLAWAIYARTQWSRETDEANLSEWLDEARVFRKSLPELTREYLAEQEKARQAGTDAANSQEIEEKQKEILEQLTALSDPTRLYQGQLPLFPEIYRLEVRFADPSLAPIVWDSPVPRPERQNQREVQQLKHWMLGEADRRAWLQVEYRLHAFDKIRRDEEERSKIAWVVVGLLFFACAGALVWVYYFLRRERQREMHQLQIQQDKEHAEKLALETELRRQEADRGREEAERSALELKSQLYASIGIMAGSYAHNIKNLLVRPNDLLARCLEADGLSNTQSSMLQEVRHTLGTVTERLQQILRTVRRDPNRSEMTRLDLNTIVQDIGRTWNEMSREKWKLYLSVETATEPLFLQGDLSHLQQAIENLIFNARDATFEMRNHLREQARKDPQLDATARKEALIDAAAWKGQVVLRTWREDSLAVLEVSDNGIGMSDQVRDLCTQTHFSTKRDNALYEGYNAGMGLGLSFVAVVLEHHAAKLEIDSAPLQGAHFRMRFPLWRG